MNTIIATVFILLCIIYNTSQQNSSISSIAVQPNTVTSYSQSQNEYKYFKTTILNPTSQQILLITVSADIDTTIDIFVITSESPNFSPDKWPQFKTSSQQCFYTSLDTCAVQLMDKSTLKNPNLTIHFTVFISQPCTYTLDISLQQIYQIQVGYRYSVNFENAEAAVMELSKQNFGSYEQVVVSCVYSSYRQIGHFQLIAAQGQIPKTNYGIKKSQSLSAFSQILKLKALDNNSSYFIMLEGSNDTRFNISFVGIQSLNNPSLQMNSTLAYLTDSPLNYTYNGPIQNNTELPLVIDLNTYRGYGQFSIDYCQNLYTFNFQNLHGESGEIQISTKLRQQCYQSLVTNRVLLLEDIVISLTDIQFEYGFSIGLYEGFYERTIFVGRKQIGVIGTQGKEQFQINQFNKAVNYTLSVQSLSGNFTLIINDCINATTNCTKILETSLTQLEVSIQKLNFICQANSICKISIISTALAPNVVPIKFSLILSYEDSAPISLQPSEAITNLVSMNEYINYVINLTELSENGIKLSNASILSIRNTNINGDAIMLTSFTNPRPTLSDCFKVDSDVVYNWQGISNIIVTPQLNITWVYISIFGNVESIFHLQYTLNVSANIPSAYISLVDNTENTFTLTSQSPFVLLKYTPHILPYSFTFSTSPASTCIKYGFKLPIPDICVNQLPDNFTQKVVYFNISENVGSGGQFKFSAFVNSDVYKLSEDSTILIACQQQCYKLISVQVIDTATVIHSGSGRITQVGTQNTASNQPLILTCQFCTIVINATLLYWGSMQVSFQSSSASQVQWRTKTITLPYEGNPKHFFMRLPKYNNFNNFIFSTEAADVTIYTSIIALNQSNRNAIDFQYPSPQDYLMVSYGSPLQSLNVVNIDNQTIQRMKCKENNFFCIATFTVYLNTSVEYSWEYLTNGLAHFSANTYEYDISPQWPKLNLEKFYSVSYFTYQLPSVKRLNRVIYIQPISNCRPQIQTESTNYLKNQYMIDNSLQNQTTFDDKLHFRVVSNFPCVFSTAISTTQHKLIFANLVNQIEIAYGQREVVLGYQHSSITNKWNIKVNEKVQSIIVGQLKYNESLVLYPPILYPTLKSNIAYSQNTTTLQVSAKSHTQYILVIRLSSDSPKDRTIQVTIKQDSHSIITLHNQQQIYVYDPSDNSIGASNTGEVEYIYYTTNSFYLFATINRLRVQVTVSDAQYNKQNSTIVQTSLTNASSPWILVNLTSPQNIQNIRKLKINFKYLQIPPVATTSTIKMHIQETGTLGLTQLYQGVSLYDAFIHSTSINCYLFKAPLIMGEQYMVVDLSFVDLGNIAKASKLGISGMSSLQQSTSSLNIRLVQISPTTYRMSLNFFAGKTYKICYTISTPSLVGKQYSIVVNSPSTPMLYLNQYPQTSSIQTQPFTTYQYINHMFQLHSPPITLTVTSCVGNTSILTSNSYKDLLTGKMTDVTNEWLGPGISVGMVDVPHGYYYLGVKSGSQDLFRVSLQNAAMFDNEAYILNGVFTYNWQLNSDVETMTSQKDSYTRIAIPNIIKQPQATHVSNPFKIVYSLYIINQIQNNTLINYPYSIQTYIRCPNLFTAPTNNPTLKFTPISVQTIQNPDTSLKKSFVEFHIPENLFVFGSLSNFSVKAEVYVQDQLNATSITEIYYLPQQFKTQTTSDESLLWGPIKWILWVCLIILVIFGIVFAVKVYMKKKGRSIDFEMAEYQFGQQMQSKTNEKQRSSENERGNNDSIKSNRKALNMTAEYGQFISEV